MDVEPFSNDVVYDDVEENALLESDAYLVEIRLVGVL